jgi:hypothetical protein
MSNVNVVIGAGSIGQAIARRVSAGKRVLLADLWEENAKAAAEVLSNAGFEVSTATIDVSSRASVHKLVEAATALGDVTGVIHAAGVSPSQASPATILRHRGRSRGARERHGSRRRSPGIIITPLANDELTGPRGEGYRAHDRAVSGRARWHSGRSWNGRRAAHGTRRRFHHGQRLPYGWRSHRLLLVRRARSEIMGPRRGPPVTFRCARGGCTPASSRADAALLQAPPWFAECGVLGSSVASHPRPSR